MNNELPEIIYEDDSVLAVNKPAGMIVNNADTTKDVFTLQDWVVQTRKFTETPLDDRDDFVLRAGIVHRLDKETSGLLLIAKDRISFQNLQAQFKAKTVKKQYTALVHGWVLPRAGTIEAPVGRLPWDRRKFGVVIDGKESLTEYRVHTLYEQRDTKPRRKYCLLDVFPQTGRTHQIRVHMRYVGFPIAGDALYAGRKNIAHDRKYVTRHLLHASHITFQHPQSGETITLQTQLPHEFASFVSQLQEVKGD